MPEPQPVTLDYSVDLPSDLAAGLPGFSGSVCVSVTGGDPGGEPGEFAQYMRDCIADWFDGAGVGLVQRDALKNA